MLTLKLKEQKYRFIIKYVFIDRDTKEMTGFEEDEYYCLATSYEEARAMALEYGQSGLREYDKYAPEECAFMRVCH